MANKAPDKIPPAPPKLDALTAEEVFGWKKTFTSMKVRLSARKQDRGGRWRLAQGALVFDQPRQCISDRRTDETA
jgi:hypothetical protein